MILDLICWIDLSDIPCGAESFKKKVISGVKQTRIATDVIVLLFNVIEPMEAMINDDCNWHEFHGLMSALKDVYPSFIERTKSHHDRPVYWNANAKTWVEQESSRGKEV